MKKRNIFLGIICFIMIFMLTGCKNKVALSTSEFSEKMQAKGYAILDITEQYSQYENIKEATIAMNSDKFQIEFYVLDTESSAQSMFDSNKTIFENSKGDTSSYSEATLKNYSTYTLTTDGKYKHICRVDNTMIYLNVDETYKDQVKEVIKELGY